MTRRFIIDWTERIGATFAEAFLALWLVAGDTQADRLFTWNNAKLGLLAGALAAGKGILASLKGRRDSASLTNTV